MDASGRVTDRAIISVLGWRGGDRLTLTADVRVVIVCRDPNGIVSPPDRTSPTSRFPASCAAGAGCAPAT